VISVFPAKTDPVLIDDDYVCEDGLFTFLSLNNAIGYCNYQGNFCESRVSNGKYFSPYLPNKFNISEGDFLSAEVDMKRHRLHFFNNDEQVPYSIKSIPEEIYFSVSFHRYFHNALNLFFNFF
jgi:hypothetical protein